jgi:hypothetical protein
MQVQKIDLKTFIEGIDYSNSKILWLMLEMTMPARTAEAIQQMIIKMLIDI